MLLPLVEGKREKAPRVWQVGRWVRWLLGGAISAATPLPWVMDVTSSRYRRLERRVDKLEREVESLRGNK